MKKEIEKEWGGLRPGAGRKPMGEKPLGVVAHIRMSEDQRDKMNLLGGGTWVRDMIDLAKLPSTK